MKLKPGGIRLSHDAFQDYTEYLVDGVVGTDGVQHSAVATFGTTAVNLFTKYIDPGYTMGLKRLQIHLEHRLVGQNGSFVASLAGFYWTIRPRYVKTEGSGAPYMTSGAEINVTGTYQINVGTLATLTGTYEGYVPVGSVPFAPFDITLTARGIQAAVCTGEVKNASFVRLVGAVIPGT